MLIPSIDLMGGHVVQLVRGEHKALEFDDAQPWIERFRAYPLVQLIDLDAAMGKGDNRALVYRVLSELSCQVGGGIRDVQTARDLLQAGAQRVILGSALFSSGAIDLAFASNLCQELGEEKLVFALDSKQGTVVSQGWKTSTTLTPESAALALEPFCDSFLYTHVDTEGLMGGIPMEAVLRLRSTTRRRLAVAGGISSMDEVEQLHALGMDAVVGMAIYSGRLAAE